MDSKNSFEALSGSRRALFLTLNQNISFPKMEGNSYFKKKVWRFNLAFFLKDRLVIGMNPWDSLTTHNSWCNLEIWSCKKKMIMLTLCYIILSHNLWRWCLEFTKFTKHSFYVDIKMSSQWPTDKRDCSTKYLLHAKYLVWF